MPDLAAALAGLDVPVFTDPPGDQRPDRYLMVIGDEVTPSQIWAVAPTADGAGELGEEVADAVDGAVDAGPVALSTLGKLPGYGCRVRPD